MKQKINLGLLGCTALTSGIASAEQSLSLHHMDYREDDQRIDVGDTSLALKLDLGVDYSLDLSLGYDSVSGASPAFQIIDPAPISNSERLQRQQQLEDGQKLTKETLLGYAHEADRYRVSRVALEDTRKSAVGALTIRDEYRNELTLGLSHSKENDYKSSGLNAAYLMYLDEFKNRSVNVGFAYLNDRTLVFGSGYKTRTEEKLQILNLEAGFTQVLSPTSTFDIKLFANRDWGYLSNHYLTVLRHLDLDSDKTLDGNELFLAADSRPDKRVALGTKLNLATQPLDWVTGQLSYRYYSDDWGIKSHTLANSVNLELSPGLFLKPEFIWYRQSAADFYRNPNDKINYFAVSGFASNDVRLGDYVAKTYSLTLNYQFDNDWQVDLSANRYEQSNQFAATWAVLGVSYNF